MEPVNINIESTYDEVALHLRNDYVTFGDFALVDYRVAADTAACYQMMKLLSPLIMKKKRDWVKRLPNISPKKAEVAVKTLRMFNKKNTMMSQTVCFLA